MRDRIDERDPLYQKAKALMEIDEIHFRDLDRGRVSAIGTIQRNHLGLQGYDKFSFYDSPFVAKRVEFEPLNKNAGGSSARETTLMGRKFSLVHHKDSVGTFWEILRGISYDAVSITPGGSRAQLELFDDSPIVPVYQGDSNYESVLDRLGIEK